MCRRGSLSTISHLPGESLESVGPWVNQRLIWILLHYSDASRCWPMGSVFSVKTGETQWSCPLSRNDILRAFFLSGMMMSSAMVSCGKRHSVHQLQVDGPLPSFATAVWHLHISFPKVRFYSSPLESGKREVWTAIASLGNTVECFKNILKGACTIYRQCLRDSLNF